LGSRSKANMFVLFSSCNDVKNYVYSDSDAGLIGLESSFLDKCMDVIASVNENVVFVPRNLKSVERKSIPHESSTKRKTLTSYIPLDTQSARILAKLRKPVVVLVSPNTLRYVDEAQVNFMRQSHERKFLEIALGQFIKFLTDSKKGYVYVEKVFRGLGDVIEHALKYDIGIVASGAVDYYPKTLFTSHIDIVFFSLGFSKRERRMILEVYPVELLKMLHGD